MYKYVIFAFLLFLSFNMIGQELLNHLTTYPELKANKTKVVNKESKAASLLSLPFADDFSYNLLYPKKELWSDRYVYVNKSFSINPPTIGVVSFDAVNDTGGVYPTISQYAYFADTLTTNPIRLDSVFGSIPLALQPSDSVVLSFWIQPQGLGNAPEEEDSLLLQFFSPSLNLWKNIWAHQGMPLDSFVVEYGVEFLQISIPVVDSIFFHSGFRFRFINKASIPNNTIPSWRSGLYDHWHLDYVYLDRNRSVVNTSVNDIAFTTPIGSLLNSYTSMPWNQYKANPTASTNVNASIKFVNLDLGPTVKNLNQYFSIQNLFDKSFTFANPFPATFNMNPNTTVTYSPNYGNYTFQSAASQYADFEVMFRLLSNTPPPDLIRTNDTMRFYQRFYNYYSYDDGTPEAGYGLSNNGARLAYQFTLNQGDSLQAIQFYFNQTVGNANQQYFYLTIWDDNNGQPNNVIYEQSGVRPQFEDQLFKYYTYELTTPIYLTGTFYVGWRQTTNDNLNIGFDFNNDRAESIFYNTGGSWVNTNFHGALMIRPILGNEKEAYLEIKPIDESVSLKIYPNPVTSGSTLFIQLEQIENGLSQATDYKIILSDISGRVIKTAKLSNSLEINDLNSGMYILSVWKNSGTLVKRSKIVVQ
ncbi:MAG: T9SS type A sorting domain-containing protein [Bacteroidales bacterium]|nr:T9SS type A sorting domain-containing protein [Bacteroidales bacterium]